MAAIPYLDRIDLDDVDWEKNARALLEYGGIPLAIFMAIGIVVSVLRGYGYYHTFLDPLQNYLFYFVVNFWIVAGVYFFRQRYQQSLLLTDKRELLVAAIPAFTWVAAQPVYLLAGYAAFMVAIFRQDTLQSSFLPDLTDLTDEEEDEDAAEAWGHIESVKDNMTV